MSNNKCKITYNINRMNCIVAVIVAILAFVIHLANTFFSRKDDDLLKVVFQTTLDEKET